MFGFINCVQILDNDEGFCITKWYYVAMYVKYERLYVIGNKDHAWTGGEFTLFDLKKYSYCALASI